jgi:hypothetical protein
MAHDGVDFLGGRSSLDYATLCIIKGACPAFSLAGQSRIKLQNYDKLVPSTLFLVPPLPALEAVIIIIITMLTVLSTS